METKKAEKIAEGGDFSFWLIGDHVFRSPSDVKLCADGFPQSRRWECSLKCWRHFRNSVFGWVKDV